MVEDPKDPPEASPDVADENPSEVEESHQSEKEPEFETVQDSNQSCSMSSVSPSKSSHASTPVHSPPPPSSAASDSIHYLKRIKFQGKKIPIITQNENGPCPMIALANVLLLRQQITLTEDAAVVTGASIIERLSDYIMNRAPLTSAPDYHVHVDQALQLFPQLLTGLDVNVRFDKVDSFENTSALSIFDLLSVSLYHGWLVDPEAEEACRAVGQLSYNQLVEKIINSKHDTDHPDRVHEGLAAEAFLEENASQLTYHGLTELTSTLQENQLAVLFRNNHFSTVHKHENVLYVLVTDMGFLHEDNFVWETLNSVDGFSQFVDSYFHLSEPDASRQTSSVTPVTSGTGQGINNSDTPCVKVTDNSAGDKENAPLDAAVPAASVGGNNLDDYALALSLQQMEADEEMARALQDQEEREYRLALQSEAKNVDANSGSRNLKSSSTSRQISQEKESTSSQHSSNPTGTGTAVATAPPGTRSKSTPATTPASSASQSKCTIS